ncbi:hypothetical protein [uncultured Shimia sp.]|uniref:hypothetical protein n=1 Tax=uncultured Shimia sp. TaxID=573152 RepID=UPI002626F7C0|nr:hypothetical protein [uncultured Shimia sp.]
MRGAFLLLFGVVLTVGFGWYVFDLSGQHICFVENEVLRCKTNYQKFLESPPNEKGDTLAGLAGSLAFLWIIVTVLLQSNELSLQRKELKRMTETQAEQTALLYRQDKRESRAIEQGAQEEKVRAMLKTLSSSLPKLGFASFELRQNGDHSKTKRVYFLSSGAALPKGEAASVEWASLIERVHRVVIRHVEENDNVVLSPRLPKSWIAVHSQAKAINAEVQGAPDGVVEDVYYRMKIPLLERVLREAINEERLWQSNGGPHAPTD